MAKKILLHKGPIYSAFVSDFTLVKGQDHLIPILDKEIVEEDALFYHFFGNYFTLDDSFNLLEEGEAISYAEDHFYMHENLARMALENEEAREECLASIKNITSCPYYVSDEIHASHVIDKKEFKTLKKENKKKRRN